MHDTVVSSAVNVVTRLGGISIINADMTMAAGFAYPLGNVTGSWFLTLSQRTHSDIFIELICGLVCSRLYSGFVQCGTNRV